MKHRCGSGVTISWWQCIPLCQRDRCRRLVLQMLTERWQRVMSMLMMRMRGVVSIAIVVPSLILIRLHLLLLSRMCDL